jgi:hypothetical protein
MASGTSSNETLETLFFSGRYRDVLAATVDAPHGVVPEALPFAVGALAFAGRLVEAELLAANVRPDAPPTALAMSAFSLAVAASRGGRFDCARAHLRRALRVTAGRRDARARAFLLQGCACVRYFRGQLARAALDARRTLAAALRANFPYLVLLANDLRGHALAQAGDAAQGTAVLQQARAQALRLGYDANAHVIELAMTLYRARDAPLREAIALLDEALARESSQDAYSRRTLSIERATLLAWSGRASEACRILAEVAPACAGEPRLLALFGLARAQVVRVTEGGVAALHVLEGLRSTFDAVEDTTLRIEATALRLAMARGIGAPVEEHVAALRALALSSGIARARAWLLAHGVGDGTPVTLPPILEAMARGTAVSLLRSGLLGLIPESVGLMPGRRFHIFIDALVVEDHGDVVQRPVLSPRSLALLQALASGVCTRSELFRTVWRLQNYDPERHGPVVKTAMSRLRAALGPQGTWVLATQDGYTLVEGEVYFHDVVRRPLAPLPGARSIPSDAGRNERQRRILDVVLRVGRVTAGDLALRLREPLRTVSRELSAMCEAKLLRREGAGRGTAYRLREVAS